MAKKKAKRTPRGEAANFLLDRYESVRKTIKKTGGFDTRKETREYSALSMDSKSTKRDLDAVAKGIAKRRSAKARVVKVKRKK